jgi:tetratricopeptide (TPR) repeat protein
MATKPKSKETKKLSKPKPKPSSTMGKKKSARSHPVKAKTAPRPSSTSKTKATSKAAAAPAKSQVPPPPPKPSGAVLALEAGIKLMFAEEYDKAIKAFKKVLADYPDEAEIQASVRARMQACEKKMVERSRSVFKSADDFYNVAVAFLNGGDVETAVIHLQSALKLAPKADHVLYALAAANALKGNKDSAITYLKQAIGSRPENRFQAGLDPDFASLSEDQAFKDLMASPDK